MASRQRAIRYNTLLQAPQAWHSMLPISLGESASAMRIGSVVQLLAGNVHQHACIEQILSPLCSQVYRSLHANIAPTETTTAVLLLKQPDDPTGVSCRKAGFQPALDPTRGFDHGTFVPLKLAFPDAVIPVVQLSLLSSLDARVCINLFYRLVSKLPAPLVSSL